MPDNEEVILLREIVMWLRFQNTENVNSAVNKYLDTDAKKRVFDLTNGSASVRDIEKQTGVSRSVVSNWWKVWFSAGILTKSDGSYKRLFNLSDFGLDAQEKKT